MASFLHACINGCGRVLRSMTPNPEPTTCDACVAAITANEAVEDEWVHKGGGYYLNKATGEKRRGKPA